MKRNPFDFDVWMCDRCGYVISDKEVKLLKFNILDVDCKCGASNHKHLHFKEASKHGGVR